MDDRTLTDKELGALKRLIADELLAERLVSIKRDCANQAQRIIDMELIEQGSLRDLRLLYDTKKLKRRMGSQLLTPFEPATPCRACQEPAFDVDRVHLIPVCDVYCYCRALLSLVTREAGMAHPSQRRLGYDIRRVERIIDNFRALFAEDDDSSV
jgi:hypothetical protein